MKTKKEFRDILLVSLLKVYVAKATAIRNRTYSDNEFNFFLLLTNRCPAAFEIVSGNLAGVSSRHMSRYKASICRKRFVNLSKIEAISKLVSHISAISTKLDEPPSFSLAIDATKVISGSQLFYGYKVIMGGGAHPGHFIDLNGMFKDQIKDKLENIKRGKVEKEAVEIKIALVTFQNTAKGDLPLFVLTRQPQTNKTSDVGDTLIGICRQAENESRAIFLSAAVD